MEKLFDPVCRMEVSRERSAGTAVFEGKEYGFCNDRCRVAFEKNPSRFTRNEPAAKPAAPHA